MPDYNDRFAIYMHENCKSYYDYNITTRWRTLDQVKAELTRVQQKNDAEKAERDKMCAGFHAVVGAAADSEPADGEPELDDVEPEL